MLLAQRLELLFEAALLSALHLRELPVDLVLEEASLLVEFAVGLAAELVGATLEVGLDAAFLLLQARHI